MIIGTMLEMLGEIIDLFGDMIQSLANMGSGGGGGGGGGPKT